MSNLKYYIFYKPFGCLSQFTKEHPDHVTLADYCKDIPKDVFPIGRLDKDSEGLLLLSNDKTVNHKLLNPRFKHSRTYLVQVENLPTTTAIEKLETGVEIKLKKAVHTTLPCKAELLDNQPIIPERNPPIRFRKTVPDSWLKMTLIEGKNRQVRKMCAKVGHPVLRLIRISIEKASIKGFQPGELIEVERLHFFRKLKLL